MNNQRDNNNNVFGGRHLGGTLVVIVVFVVLTIFMLVHIFRSYKEINTAVYQVIPSVNYPPEVYVGLILRDEELIYSSYNGEVTYFTREAERISKSQIVCMIDESGALRNLMEGFDAPTEFSEDDFLRFEASLNSFVSEFSLSSFENAYTYKNSLLRTLMDSYNSYMLDVLEPMINELNCSEVLSEKSGIIKFSYDNYEALSIDDIITNPSKYLTFDFTESAKNELIKTHNMFTLDNGITVDTQTPIYRILTSHEWDLVFPMSLDDYKNHIGDTKLSIDFYEKNIVLTGDFKCERLEGDVFLGYVHFDSGVNQFEDLRYTSFRIEKNYIEGLKVPQSSVIDIDAYKIPLTHASINTGKSTCELIPYNADNNLPEKTTYPIIFLDDEFVYISSGEIKEGTLISKIESENATQSTEEKVINELNSMHIVKDKTPFKGVFVLNKGFTQFRIVNILVAQTGGFYIIENKNPYSITVYDRIALNGQKMSEGEFAFK